ncbi:ABC transporter ATP-binding protein [Methanofollis sp. UBA420]|jgi:energy-coupling factor transport system ATP-binding protein|uniref:ABC transporter ATP-binding protein n=1 Tax=Methanofollis sp. UBA420 TaxID=1915514 RepID=UPI00316AE88C
MVPDAILIEGLSVSYPPDRSGQERQALKSVSLAVREGEFVLLAGPSGSGKSTLLRCVNGLIPHSHRGTAEGRVVVRGHEVRDCQVCRLALEVGTVFQDPDHQLFTTSVEAELAFGLEQIGLSHLEMEARISRAAGTMGIGHLLKRDVDALSWGEKQRVAIAAVLVMEPSVLLLDEPTSGLDAAAARRLVAVLSRLNRERGLTIVVAEHRTAPFLQVCTRVVGIRDGTVVSDGPPVASAGPLPEAFPAVTGPGAGTSLLAFEGVTYTYPGQDHPALDSVTFGIGAGEIVLLTGPNGSGKSTLLRHANGLLRPDRGKVIVNGRETVSLTVAEAARSVGLLAQHADTQLFAETVRDEIAFAPENLGYAQEKTGLCVQRALKILGLERIGTDTPPLNLSVGEKQRVAIASILAMDTPVLVLDEPTLGLDPARKAELAALLRDRTGAGCAVLVATHDPEFAAFCGGRRVALRGGRVVAEGDEG